MGKKIRKNRPPCKLSGTDSNTFFIIARVAETLKNAGLKFCTRIPAVVSK